MAGYVTLIVCGAPLTERAPDVIRALQAAGREVVVVATPAAHPWLDHDLVRELTGSAPQSDFRDPSQPKREGDTEGVVLCPGTFNTINQAAAGAANTYALAQLCSAIGEGLPVIAVPFVNNKLWGHPAWKRSLTVLEDAGVKLVDVHTGKPGAAPVQSGTGPEAVARFDPAWVADLLG
ncbi:flavoprotein [Actinoplanes sp. NPDC051861]|uniref:flavoprotein n=1 Tax=Actinoplanes sp. NPDC051861 TaxID=3155170 RepID=UPI00342433BF